MERIEEVKMGRGTGGNEAGGMKSVKTTRSGEISCTFFIFC
jgi:hypothetical protein